MREIGGVGDLSDDDWPSVKAAVDAGAPGRTLDRRVIAPDRRGRLVKTYCHAARLRCQHVGDECSGEHMHDRERDGNARGDGQRKERSE